MERSILIVEDNQGVATLIEELCADLGLSVTQVRGGTEAIAQLTSRAQASQPLPDAVVLDLVLSELDGFQVAAQLRALPGGGEVPLIVISGVYKKLPEAFAQAVRPHFLPKPFEPAGLRKLLQDELAAIDRAHGIERGRFLTSTPSELFARLCDRRASGLLEVATTEARRRLWWQSGQIRFGQSNVRSETAGAMQVQQGEITAAAFDRAVAHARQSRQPLFEALVATRVLSPERLNEALRAQTQEVALGILGMAGTGWMFSEADPEKVPDARRHPLALLVEHARRTMTPDDAREALLHAGDATVTRAPLLDREAFVIRGAWPGETVTALLSGPVSLVGLVAKAREDDLPFLWVLVQSGLAPAARRAEGTPTPSSVRATPPPDEIDQTIYSPAERKARQYILSERGRTAGFDHYQLLGVPRGAAPEEIHAAFLDRARDYHSDSYANLNLGSTHSLLSGLFQRLNEAQETLSDPSRRQEYDLRLARQAEGLPTDVAIVLEAEEIFKRAVQLVKSNVKAKATTAVELLDQAIALNGADPDFHVYRAYAAFRTKAGNRPQAAAAAREAILRVQEKAPNLASAHLFLGLLARDLGQDADAIRHLEQALELDAADEFAVRELRTLRAHPRKNGEGSLFRRLFRR